MAISPWVYEAGSITTDDVRVGTIVAGLLARVDRRLIADVFVYCLSPQNGLPSAGVLSTGGFEMSVQSHGVA
jgi:hypothetical protein